MNLSKKPWFDVDLFGSSHKNFQGSSITYIHTYLHKYIRTKSTSSTHIFELFCFLASPYWSVWSSLSFDCLVYPCVPCVCINKTTWTATVCSAMFEGVSGSGLGSGTENENPPHDLVWPLELMGGDHILSSQQPLFKYAQLWIFPSYYFRDKDKLGFMIIMRMIWHYMYYLSLWMFMTEMKIL